jgi:hypothetical protein
MAALAADAVGPTIAEQPEVTHASPPSVVPIPELVPAADDATISLVPGAVPAQTQAPASEASTVPVELPSPQPRPGKRLVVAVAAAVLLLAAIGYAITSRSTRTATVPQPAATVQAGRADSALSKPTENAPAKAETTMSARVNAAPAAKPETKAKRPAVVGSKANVSPTKTAAPKTAGQSSKRDAAGSTRPDSNAARCAALSLKFSLGEVTKADSVFLRSECARPQPRGPGL